MQTQRGLKLIIVGDNDGEVDNSTLSWFDDITEPHKFTEIFSEPGGPKERDIFLSTFSFLEFCVEFLVAIGSTFEVNIKQIYVYALILFQQNLRYSRESKQGHHSCRRQ